MIKIARRRAIATAAAVIAATMALAGCSAATATTKSTLDSSKPVSLEVWSWIPGAVQAAKAYHVAHPNVTVHIDDPADVATKLSTALKAGSGAPDVSMAAYTDLPQLAASGGLADLGTYGATKFKSDYQPWTWNLVSQGSHVYGLPQDVGPTALVYNKDVLAKYNITPPKTWAEFATDADKLKQASGGTVAIANIPGTYADWFLGLEWQAGGRPWTRNSDGSYSQHLANTQAQKVASLWQGMLDKKELTTYPAFSQDLWGALAKGQIATSIEAAWGAGGLSDNVPASTAGLWRVADLPQWTAGASAAGDAGGSLLVVPKQGAHVQAALAFAHWLTSSEQGTNTQYTVSGTFSASKTGQSLKAFSDKTVNPSKFFGGQNISAVYAKAAKGVNQTFVYAPWYPAASDGYNAAFAPALTGKITLSQALKNWQSTALAQAKAQGYNVK